MNIRAWKNASRLTGRLLVVMALLLTGASIAKAAPTETLVQDTLYKADGSASQGNLTIRWNAFTTSAGEAVAAGEMTVATGVNGAISIPLIPNAGATPVGGYYRVVIKLNDGTTSEENWVVPATATTTLAMIRAQVVPQSVAAQFVSRGYVDGQIAGLAPVATSGNYNDLKNTPAIPNLASPGEIGAITPALVNATDVITRSTPYADVRAYGGTCDGIADDTVAFQAAANSLATTGGTIYAPNCKIGAVTFPAYKVQTTLRIDRKLTLTSNTLVIPSNLNIEGVAGGGQTQFGIGPLAAIIPPVGNIPTVQFIADQSSMKNIAINNPGGYGIDVEFSNFHRFENVQVIVYPSNTSGVPVYIANGMDIEFENCVFNQGNSALPYVVHYTIAAHSDPSDWQKGSTVHFDHGAWLNYGMLIDTPATVADGAVNDFRIKDIRYQSGNNPLLSINTAGGAINDVLIDNVGLGDQVGTWPLVYIAPGNTFPVTNLSIRGASLTHWVGRIFNSDAPEVNGLFIEGIPSQASYELGSQSAWTWDANGQTDTSLTGLPLSPVTVPYATQPVGLPSTWGINATYTNVTGPDGLNNGSAVHIPGPNAATTNQLWSKSSGYAVGDWVIWGGWLKGDPGVAPGYYQLTLNGGSANGLDNASPAEQLTTSSYDGAWTFVSKATKITGTGTGALNFAFFDGSSTGSAIAYPFVVYVPASAAINDAEIVRWQRHLLKGIVPPNMAAGAVSTVPVPFNSVTSGTNTSAAMLIGTGASLAPTGSGTITATTASTANSLAQTFTYVSSGTYTVSSASPAIVFLWSGTTVVLPTTGVTVGQEVWLVNIGNTGPLTITNSGSADNVPSTLQAGATVQLKLFSSTQWVMTGGSGLPSPASYLAQIANYVGSSYTAGTGTSGIVLMYSPGTLTLTTGLTAGLEFWVVNSGPSAITIVNNGSADNVPATIPAGQALQFKLYSSTQWFVVGGYIGATGNVTSLAASGNVSGSTLSSTVATGTAPFTVTSTTPVANLSIGGNAATATSAISATTATNVAGGALGSMQYQSAANTTATLSGNTSATPAVLMQTGTGAASAAPVWMTATGTGSPVLSTAPTFTGVASFAGISSVGNVAMTGGGTTLGWSNAAISSGGGQLFYFGNGTNGDQSGKLYGALFRAVNGSYYNTVQTNTLSANRNFNMPDGNSFPVVVASLTTTSATSDTVAVQGMTSGGHCSLTATNATAATNIAATYISAKTTNQITVAHAATAGMTYDVMCTSN